MAYLGFGDLKDQVVHPLWDLAELKRLELRDGTTFDQMVSEAQDVANAVSGEITRIPHFSTLFGVQDNPDLEYGTYTGGKIQEMTEYSVPDPYRGKTTGHMLPIKMFIRTIGWTYLALENRRRNQLEADLNVVVDDIRNHYQQRVLQRFFKSVAEDVGATSGASVPLADGGTADSTWIPLRSPDGEEFANTHNHYLRHAAINDANLLLAVDHLKEHGHQPPFDVLAAEADAATWANLTGWLKPDWSGIIHFDASSGTDRALLENQQMYNGFVETSSGIVRVKLLPRIPTAYYGLYKVYGAGSAKSPLRMRIDPQKGFGWSIVPGNYVNSPLNLAVLRAEWDIGIGEDRTNGVLVYINAAGNYVDPTIS